VSLSAAPRRIISAGALGLAGLVTLYVSFRVFQLDVVNGAFPIGLYGAVIGAAAGAYLMGVGGAMLAMWRSFLELHGFVILGVYLAMLLGLIIGAAYIALELVIMGIGSLSEIM
jgi:hypothetical protein